MQAIARYTCSAVGASSVTLAPKAGLEDADLAGDPNVFGSGGTITLTTTSTPSAAFWKVFSSSGRQYLVTIQVLL